MQKLLINSKICMQPDLDIHVNLINNCIGENIEWFNNVVRPKTDGYQQVSGSDDLKEFDH